MNWQTLANDIKSWGQQLGFAQIGITNTELAQYEARFLTWLSKGYHGEMDYLSRHGSKRTHPAELVPNTTTIITARMDYLPPHTQMVKNLQNPLQGYISRYAVGQDYHKLLRKKLEKLAQKIGATTGPFGYRVFTDSAPVLEKPLAEKSGLGWIGKNTLVLNKTAGSWFFLGVIYTDLPLPVDNPGHQGDCGNCTACINICPTQAIVAPYVLDARRCISYLTIELKGSIPVELRPLIGNRIYGCDDCQLICPWNRFAKPTDEVRFHPRHGLTTAGLLDLFAWSEAEFLENTLGSPIRRIGYEQWQRNIAVALGNAPRNSNVSHALQSRLPSASPLVQEHIHWALSRTEMTAPLSPKMKMAEKLNPNF